MAKDKKRVEVSAADIAKNRAAAVQALREEQQAEFQEKLFELSIATAVTREECDKLMKVNANRTGRLQQKLAYLAAQKKRIEERRKGL